MNREHMVLVALCALFVGCYDNGATREIERDLDVIIPKLGVEYSHPLWERLYAKVNAQTNDVDRLAYCRSIFEKLHSIKFVLGDYRRQIRLFDEVHVHAGFNPLGGPQLGLSMAELFRYRLRDFAWMRDQLECLRPKRPIVRGKMTSDEIRQWEEWRNAYCYCRDYYEMRLGMFEKHYGEYCDKYKIGEEERIRIEKMITEFLGRPIRGEQQVDADRKAMGESDEMKAIWRCEVGP